MELRNDLERFEAAGLQIVAIGQGSAARAKEFRAEMDLSFPLLADPRRVAYQAYGLLHMDIRREANLKSAINGARAIIKYGAAHSPDQDVRQLGGAFVVGTDGTILFAHRAQRASDNPAHEALLGALK